MTTNPKHSRPALRSAFIAFALFLLVFYWLVVATYPEFFIFNPLDDGWAPRQFALLLSLLGWFVISTAPAVILISYSLGKTAGIRWLPFVALGWPVSVAVNQLLLFVRDGVWYWDYLINHPIFIATDLVLPALLIALYFDLRSNQGSHSQSEEA